MNSEKRRWLRAKRKGAQSRLFDLLMLGITMLLISSTNSYAQDRTSALSGAVAQKTSGQQVTPVHDRNLNECGEPATQQSGSYKFRWQGESFDIPLSGDCQAVGLELRWSNGRNNGSNFHVTFLDSDDQPIYTKELSGFLTGSFLLPFSTIEPGSWQGSRSMMAVAAVPAKVVIQTVRPFAFPANISYTIIRPAGQPRQQQSEVRSGTADERKSQRVKEESAGSPDSGKARKQ